MRGLRQRAPTSEEILYCVENERRGQENFVPLKDTCLFCRTECAETYEEEIDQMNALVSKGNVNAMFHLAMHEMHERR